MKSFLIISLVLSACLMNTVRSASSLTVQTSDTSVATTYPLTVTPSSTNTPQSITAGTATATTVIPTTSITYTARYTTAGIPLNMQWVLNGEAAGAYATVITVTLGSQVSLTVVGTVASNTGVTAGTSQSTASGVSISTTTACGNYFIDCMAGTLTFQMYTTNAAGATCTVAINQVAAIVGILQIPTSTVGTSPFASTSSAITTANAATSAMTTICASTTVNTNTLLYFISTFGSAVGDAQTAAYTRVRTAAMGGNLNGNTAYMVANLQPSIAGGQSAPSAQAGSLSTVNKSSSKLVVFAGLFTTAIATLFGLAL